MLLFVYCFVMGLFIKSNKYRCITTYSYHRLFIQPYEDVFKTKCLLFPIDEGYHKMNDVEVVNQSTYMSFSFSFLHR